MEEARSQPGQVLANRYRLDAPLGSGGFGTIWRAQHLVLQAPVAVKLIDPEIAKDSGAVERFMREARAAAALRSPHVVQILDYGVDGDLPFIVMELLDGENLAQRIRRLGRLPANETARLLNHVARAISRAHEVGVVHRDLKPENVFIVRNEDEEVAKVLDFGVAKVDSGGLTTSSARTRTGSLLGTPYYMSPEQVQGNKEVDYRTDLWAIGVMAFEALTGKKPFYSDGLGDLVLQICVRPVPIPSEAAPVPPGFDDWFAKATARNPDERFQSAREMVDKLREVFGVGERETIVTVPEDSSFPPSGSDVPMASTSPPEAGSSPRAAQSGTQAAPVNPDAETIHQFETSPPHRSSSPVVLVAGIGLLAGVGLVLGWMSYERSMTFGPSVSARTRRIASEPVAVAAKSAQDPAQAGEATPLEDAGADASPSGVQIPSIAVDARANASLTTPDAAMPDASADAWVKPEWARPDEDPLEPSDPYGASRPETESPSSPPPADVPIENPY